MLSIDDVLEILSLPLIGIVPESQSVLRASNLGSPVTLANPKSAAAGAYIDAARRLKARRSELTIPTSRKSFLRGSLPEGGMSVLLFFQRPNSSSAQAPTGAGQPRVTGSRSCSRTSGPSRADPS